MNEATTPRWLPSPSGLECRNLAKSFGGVHAVQDISAFFPAGRLTALVGPNGAGKTTLFNLLSGSLRPDGGEALLDGHRITGLKPWEVARRGVARLFQEGRVFPRLTVLENLLVAQRSGFVERATACLTQKDIWGSRLLIRLRGTLASVGLERHAEDHAGALSFGERKLLSILMALTADREVLLVDEPASGLSEQLKATVEKVLRHEADRGRVVLIIEHDIAFVRRLASVVNFMTNGKIIATGTPEVVFGDPTIQAMYLGL